MAATAAGAAKPGSPPPSSSWQSVVWPPHVPLSHQQSDQTFQPNPVSGTVWVLPSVQFSSILQLT